MKFLKIPFSFLLGLLVFMGCNLEDDFNPQDQFEEDIALIEMYLADNSISATTHSTGLVYTIEDEGNGENPSIDNYIFVKYKGYFLDGTVFDQTPEGDTSVFKLNELIAAWQIGVPLLGKGGKGTFYCPSALAFGNVGSGTGSVPANTVTVFEIELIDFTNQPGIEEFFIQEYIKENDLMDVQKDSSGIYYVIEELGMGEHPTVQDTVEVAYTGYLLNGDVFDGTNEGATATFPLLGLIQGWQIAVPKLKEGGKGTFFMPSAVGYGNQITGNIPANSVLVFDIELVDIK